jgi:hypothetical protein
MGFIAMNSNFWMMQDIFSRAMPVPAAHSFLWAYRYIFIRHFTSGLSPAYRD